MQEAFRPVVEALESECRAHFGQRICSAYLHGSVEKDDAVCGLSDLDYFLILHDNVQAEDWLDSRAMAIRLEKQYDAVDEIHLSLQSLSEMRQDPFTRFVLTYHASLRMGVQVETALGDVQRECFCPDQHLAKWRLAFARQCFAEALSGRQPACTGVLPANSNDCARKMARYFIVTEGAYFLMARGLFEGFGKQQVLPRLRESAPMFGAAIDLAEQVLYDHVGARVGHRELLDAIAPFVHWMFDEIERA